MGKQAPTLTSWFMYSILVIAWAMPEIWFDKLERDDENNE